MRLKPLQQLAAFAQPRRWYPLRYLTLLAVPGALCVALDLVLRGSRILAFWPEFWQPYVLAVARSFIVWGTLLHATTTPRPWLRFGLSVLFLVCFTLALGGQVYFFGQYQAYLTRSVAEFAVNMLDSVRGQLLADWGRVARTQLPFLVIAALLVLGARQAANPKPQFGARAVRWLAPLLLIAGALLPVQFRRQQPATPDALYLNALGSFFQAAVGLGDPAHSIRPRQRQSISVPQLSSLPVPQRNVLLLITESVRADAVCAAGDAVCYLTPATHQALPDRISLKRARALSSTTAISIAVLWSGLLPTESDETLHTWPLLFDYARAANWDTAYWTSQSLLFGNSRLWVKNLGARISTNATALDPEADIDLGADEALLADHVLRYFHQLKEPFLAVVQLSNTHFPYLVRETRGGVKRELVPASGDPHLDRYRDAIFQQDQHVARMLAALRATEAGKRTVVVFTSDHGEAFQEHHQVGHTLSIFDEELRVPAFVDAPPATLTEAERAALLSRRDSDVFHTDITPTVLDLMGLWRAKLLAPLTVRLPGQSWLRPVTNSGVAVPLTNCTPLWSCALENWGVMLGTRKLLAQGHQQSGARCFDVAQDPREQTPVPVSDCAALEPAFYSYFARLPE